jgi:hypothetical protein
LRRGARGRSAPAGIDFTTVGFSVLAAAASNARWCPAVNVVSGTDPKTRRAGVRHTGHAGVDECSEIVRVRSKGPQFEQRNV